MSLAYGGHILMHEIPMINISASIPVPVWLKLISVAIRRRLSNKVDKLLLTFRKLLRTRCCSFVIKNNQWKLIMLECLLELTTELFFLFLSSILCLSHSIPGFSNFVSPSSLKVSLFHPLSISFLILQTFLFLQTLFFRLKQINSIIDRKCHFKKLFRWNWWWSEGASQQCFVSYLRLSTFSGWINTREEIELIRVIDRHLERYFRCSIRKSGTWRQ